MQIIPCKKLIIVLDFNITEYVNNLQQISNNIKDMQQKLLSTSQQLKQLKENLKYFKKEKKSLESEMNEIEKQLKQLKTKHENIFKTLEFKCTYWVTVDETLLKMRIKCDHISNLALITKNSDILTDQHLEYAAKYLKVNTKLFNHRV